MTTYSKKNTFCTITTADYWPYVLALNESILTFDRNSTLHVLVTDDVRNTRLVPVPDNVYTHTTAQLCGESIGKKIFDKYHAHQMDNFRWSMKSVFIRHLLTQCGYDKVIYVDNDIHFFNSPSFLFDALNNSDILLTPHWRASDPTVDPTNFICMFTSGIFNGGFIGANRNGTKAMEWWAGCCAEICEIDACKGQFVDQTHLNLMPVYFDNVEILKHRGCNVANWNQVECQRIRSDDDTVSVAGYPIVFVHFTPSTIRGVVSGGDVLLRDHLELFASRLRQFGRHIDLNTPNYYPPFTKTSFIKSAWNFVERKVPVLSHIRHLIQ